MAEHPDVPAVVLVRHAVEAGLALRAVAVAADDDLGPPVVVEVDDRGRRPHRVHQERREAGHHRAVAVPRVEVLIEAGRDDLGRAVVIEVGDRGRAEDAVPRREAGVLLVEHEAATAGDALDLTVGVGDDDVEHAVAGDVGEDGRALDGARARHEVEEQLAVGVPPPQHAVHEPGDDVGLPVPVDVADRGRAERVVGQAPVVALTDREVAGRVRRDGGERPGHRGAGRRRRHEGQDRDCDRAGDRRERTHALKSAVAPPHSSP